MYGKKTYKSRSKKTTKRYSKKRYSKKFKVPRKLTAKNHLMVKKTISTILQVDIPSSTPLGGYFSPTGLSDYIQLALIPEADTYCEMFEKYRINGVKYEFQSVFLNANLAQQQGNINAPTQIGLINPQVLAYIDYDGTSDSSLLLNDFLNRPNLKKWNLNRKKTIYFKPRALAIANDSNPPGSGTAAVLQPSRKTWFDTSVANAGKTVKYYGLQTAMNFPVFQGTSTEGELSITVPVYITLYLEFKGVKSFTEID